jgi:hypothetical protein
VPLQNPRVCERIEKIAHECPPTIAIHCSSDNLERLRSRRHMLGLIEQLSVRFMSRLLDEVSYSKEALGVPAGAM